MNTQRVFLAAFVIVAGIISYQDIRYCSELPWPPRFIFTALTFGLLDLASPMAPELTALMAGGMTLGFGLCTLAPAQACGFFKPDCDKQTGKSNHEANATAQPAAYQFLKNSGGVTAPGPGTPGAGPAGGFQGPTNVPAATKAATAQPQAPAPQRATKAGQSPS